MKSDTQIVVPNTLQKQVAVEEEKRKVIASYVKRNLKSGTDYYTLKIGGRESKPSLSKPGSEKVMSLLNLRAEFVKDADTWEMMGSPAGVITYICRLYTRAGKIVGEGRGARDSKKDGGDVNKAIKMAEKSAQIDAVLRIGGLSDVFTQDIEDMQDTPGVVIRADELPRSTPTPKSPKDAIAGFLFKLGHDVRKMGGDAADEKVKELTGLTMEKANWDEILARLQELISEKP